ncbi:MAG: pyruvate synthase [candidate division WS1 bacterium]|jgi:pyruvate ferredoxin oxidoreductase gamma subunit|nr:pyruvate synthase [candidate division WS1 bacterium]
MAQMTEVRFHGRGGQGAKTAGYILAVAAAEEGWNINAFPEYGAERRGAPMKSYVRISKDPIRLRSGVRHPNVVVVLDDTLLATEHVTDGMEPGAVLVINTDQSVEQIREQLASPDVNVFVVDATQIARDTIGRPIPNTPMLGAMAKAADLVELDSLKRAVDERLGGKLSQAAIESNYAALQRAYEEVHS